MHGVVFHLEDKVAAIDETAVRLEKGGSVGVIALVVVALIIAALVKYVFFR